MCVSRHNPKHTRNSAYSRKFPGKRSSELRCAEPACESRASNSAARPSAAPTRDIPRLPKSPPGWRALAGHSAVAVPAAVAPVAFREELHSEVESRISGDSRCSDKIRSALSASLPAPLCDTAHTLPGNIPTSPCVPIQPSSKLPLSRVTSYVSRQPPLGLHLAWLDTCP